MRGNPFATFPSFDRFNDIADFPKAVQSLLQPSRVSCPMPSHKFKIGESVMVKPAISRNVPGGVYEVTKQLPHNGREFEYRIKSASESHERVAQESELTKA